MATIKDVAALAGVSVSTVSNVINNKQMVCDEKYERVMSAIRTLRYNPNLHAKNLRTQQSDCFAVVLPELDDLSARILEGIGDVLEARRFQYVLRVTKHNASLEANYLNELWRNGTAGIFLSTCDNRNTPLFNRLTENGVPLLFFGNYPRQDVHAAVIFKNTSLVVRALNRLKAAGKLPEGEDFAAVTSAPKYADDEDCLTGIRQVLGDSFLQYTVSAVEDQAFSELVNLFHRAEHIPKLFFSARAAVTSALKRVLAFFGEEAEILTFGDGGGGEDPYLIGRSPYRLGETAAGTMLKYVKAPLYFERTVFTLPETQILPEKYPLLSPPPTRALRLALFDGPTSYALVRSLKTFERQFRVKTEYRLLDYDGLYQFVQSSAPAKDESADVFMIDLPWFAFLRNADTLYPLDEFLRADGDGYLENFPQDIRKLFLESPGGVLSVPLLANMQHLFYRKDLFDDFDTKNSFFRKYGIELAPPRTWFDFETIARFFTRSRNPDSPVRYGTTLQGFNPITISEEFFPRFWSYGGKILSSSGALAVNSPALRQTLMNLKSTYECSPGKEISPEWKEESDRIFKNEIAMYFTFSTHINMTPDSPNDVNPTSIGITHAPRECSMLGGWSLAVNRYSRVPEVGYAFCKWMTGSKMAVPNSILGCCVPHNALFESDRCRRFLPWIPHLRSDIVTARRREVIRDRRGCLVSYADINAVIFDVVTALFDGELTVDDAALQMERRFRNILE